MLPTSLSTLSPARCPWVSFICLKLSKSIMITEKGYPYRLKSLKNSHRVLSKDLLFLSPVRGSMLASSLTLRSSSLSLLISSFCSSNFFMNARLMFFSPLTSLIIFLRTTCMSSAGTRDTISSNFSPPLAMPLSCSDTCFKTLCMFSNSSSVMRSTKSTCLTCSLSTLVW